MEADVYNSNKRRTNIQPDLLTRPVKTKASAKFSKYPFQFITFQETFRMKTTHRNKKLSRRASCDISGEKVDNNMDAVCKNKGKRKIEETTLNLAGACEEEREELNQNISLTKQKKILIQQNDEDFVLPSPEDFSSMVLGNERSDSSTQVVADKARENESNEEHLSQKKPPSNLNSEEKRNEDKDLGLRGEVIEESICPLTGEVEENCAFSFLMNGKCKENAKVCIDSHAHVSKRKKKVSEEKTSTVQEYNSKSERNDEVSLISLKRFSNNKTKCMDDADTKNREKSILQRNSEDDNLNRLILLAREEKRKHSSHGKKNGVKVPPIEEENALTIVQSHEVLTNQTEENHEERRLQNKSEELYISNDVNVDITCTCEDKQKRSFKEKKNEELPLTQEVIEDITDFGIKSKKKADEKLSSPKRLKKYAKRTMENSAKGNEERFLRSRCKSEEVTISNNLNTHILLIREAKRKRSLSEKRNVESEELLPLGEENHKEKRSQKKSEELYISNDVNVDIICTREDEQKRSFSEEKNKELPQTEVVIEDNFCPSMGGVEENSAVSCLTRQKDEESVSTNVGTKFKKKVDEKLSTKRLKKYVKENEERFLRSRCKSEEVTISINLNTYEAKKKHSISEGRNDESKEMLPVEENVCPLFVRTSSLTDSTESAKKSKSRENTGAITNTQIQEDLIEDNNEHLGKKNEKLNTSFTYEEVKRNEENKDLLPVEQNGKSICSITEDLEENCPLSLLKDNTAQGDETSINEGAILSSKEEHENNRENCIGNILHLEEDRQSQSNKILLPRREESDSSGAETSDGLNKVMIKKLEKLSITIPWEVPKLHTIETRISTVPKPYQKEQMKRLDVPIKLGFYNEAEDKRIESNWKEFCKLHNLPEDPIPFTDFRCLKGVSWLPTSERIKFARFLAHGLNNRPLRSVYKRFQTLFSNKNIIKGRFTEEENKTIREFMEKTTSKTPHLELAKILNRDRSAVYKTVKKRKNINNQRVLWNKKKIKKFLRLCLEITQNSKIEDLKNKQFSHEEWLILSKKMKIPILKLQSAWSRTIYPRVFIRNSVSFRRIKSGVLEILMEKDEDDWKNINWGEIAENFTGFTPYKLNALFKRMVQVHVPEEKRKNLQDCLQYLSEHNVERRFRTHVLEKLDYEVLRKQK